MSDITQKIKSTLTNAFNKAGHYKVVNGQRVAIMRNGTSTVPCTFFVQPPVDFEKQTGMKGLSCQYFLPPGLVARELQEYSAVLLMEANPRPVLSKVAAKNPGLDGRLLEIWGYLKACNPYTLGKLDFDVRDAKKMHDVIQGVASAFLPEDIQAWLDGNTGETVRENKEAALLINKVEVCCGYIGWIPSLKTLREMDRQMGDIKEGAQRISSPPPFAGGQVISSAELVEQIKAEIISRLKP